MLQRFILVALQDDEDRSFVEGTADTRLSNLDVIGDATLRGLPALLGLILFSNSSVRRQFLCRKPAMIDAIFREYQPCLAIRTMKSSPGGALGSPSRS